MTRRLVTAVTLALVWMIGLSAGHATAQTRSCRALNFGNLSEFKPVPVAVPPRAHVRLTLPVVVHYMKSTDPRHAPANDLRQVFSEDVLTNLFDAKDSTAVTVNTIWRQAKIRLALHRAEECDYNPADFEIVSGDKELTPSPMAGSFGPRMFNAISRTFNAPDVPGLDLYLWMDIKAGLVGYGASHRASDHRIGAAWVDKGCVTTLGPRCPVLVAHEIGHFLGLCHSCENTFTDSGTCTVCLPEGTAAAPACGDPENFLMRAWFDGTGLTKCEIGQARRKAAERLNSK
jgi:Metallo-peptidase family M12B Reprolysin-like